MRTWVRGQRRGRIRGIRKVATAFFLNGVLLILACVACYSLGSLLGELFFGSVSLPNFLISFELAAIARAQDREYDGV